MIYVIYNVWTYDIICLFEREDFCIWAFDQMNNNDLNWVGLNLSSIIGELMDRDIRGDVNGNVF